MAQFDKLHLGKTPFVGLDRLSHHLTYHSRRQEVIAGNLANLDTPGYRSRDLVFHEQLNAQIRDGEWVGDMEHREEMVTWDDEVPDQDGNTVSLERQMARTAANTLRYETISQLLSRKLTMLRYGAKDGKQ
ncbi:MAG: hypothetical protein B7733_09485 [Myxococcales bacterium FL481]|nr:MAG: hypothetical protein B7733_09485 [Myxococcales bacterium FL481]